MGPTPDNERGFWEPKEIAAINDEILASAGSSWHDVSEFPDSWFASDIAASFKRRLVTALREDFSDAPLFIVKDPRICRLVPLWLSILEQMRVAPLFVIPIRNPLEVTASLRERDAFFEAKSLLLWLRHFLAAERSTRGLRRSFVAYDHLLRDWRGVVDKIGCDLEVSWPRQSHAANAEIEDFVSTRLRHHVFGSEEVHVRGNLVPWVKTAFDWGMRAANGRPTTSEELDAVHASLEAADLAFMPLIAANEANLAAQADELQCLRAEVVSLSEASEALRAGAAGLTAEVTARDANIAALNERLAERDLELRGLRDELTERGANIAALNERLAERDLELRGLRGELTERDANIAALNQRLAERDLELRGLRDALTEQNASIVGLQSTISALQASTSWRITAPLRFVKRLLGRFRYSAVGYPLMLCWRVLRTRSRAPLRDWRAARTIANSGFLDREWYLRMNPDVAACGIDSVRHYVAFGAREGRDPSPSFSTRDYLSHNPDVAAAGLNPLLHFTLYGASEGRVASSSSGPCTPLQLKSRHGGAGDQAVDSSAAVGLFHEARACEKDAQVAESLYHLTSPRPNLREAFIAWCGNAAIDFPPVAAPEVSIIIPAHRGLADLETCLRSLSVHRATEPPFEVIVLDDCPDEPVLWAIPSSGGLIKIANEKNLGFLLTCNRGAAAARGRILCFLNSDTVVSAGWLRSLVEALDDMPRAAAAGGMLLNVDGTIQDAGWRILGDGWGCPIGRGSDPRSGSYTYRRLVDCVGGACFVVPRTIWNELGGFDTSYAPAYYEEFDFAFRAKARGLQVIYEPRSRVLHLGSASYGVEQRDELSSINHARFCKRFADILRKHPSDTADEFTLRHASGEGPVLLVIDYRVPQPDQHAGDVTISKYLAMLATAGWRVVFGPVNGRAEGLAAEALERQGIELIRAPVTIEEWLQKYGKHVREVWLSRPEVAEKLLAPLRARTDAHITYYTHDLHHLRLQREAELHADPKLKVEAAKVKVLECEIFRSVDRVTTPSAAEAEIVRHLSPETPVTVLPLNYYDAAEIRAYDTAHFTALSDIVFVGGFPHLPNVDAALFIANEIMPLVWRERPEVRLLLIGYAPPTEVRALAGPRIVVTGQVPKLEPFFDASRVFLAALRYGAGVKGKIVEAMCLGLPVVTTPVGAEGIGIEPGFNAIVAEDASGLARGVLELLHDAERCAGLSKAGADLVRHQFSRAAARHALNEVFRTPL